MGVQDFKGVLEGFGRLLGVGVRVFIGACQVSFTVVSRGRMKGGVAPGIGFRASGFSRELRLRVEGFRG